MFSNSPPIFIQAKLEIDEEIKTNQETNHYFNSFSGLFTLLRLLRLLPLIAVLQI